MKESAANPSEMIVSLLQIGSSLDVEALFELIVHQAPRLVGARECSIFWRDGIWRKERGLKGGPDTFFRRATYEAKRHLIGKDSYEAGFGLTGWVAKHKKTLNIHDITDEAALRRISKDLQWSDNEGGFRSSNKKDHQKAFLAVPVTMDNECVGVIRIAKTIEPNGRFRDTDVELLEAFSNNISAIVWRAEENEQKSKWDDLYISGIEQGGKFTDYMQEVVNKIPKYLSAEACSIFLVQGGPQGVELYLDATTRRGALESQIGKATYGFGEGLTGWVAETKRSLRLSRPDDTDELHAIDPKLKNEGKYKEGERNPFLACSLQIRGRVLGVIRVIRGTDDLPFSSSDQRFLEYFCTNLAVLMQNWLLIKDLEAQKDSAVIKLNKQAEDLRNLGKLFYNELSENLKKVSSLFPDFSKSDTKYIEMGPITFRNVPRSDDAVFIGIPFGRSARNVLDHGILPALKELGLKWWYGEEQSSQRMIMQKVFEAMHQSSIAIIDISDWNANVLFELGALYALNKEVILLKREDAAIPVDLAGMEYIPYIEFDKLAEQLRTRIPLVRRNLGARPDAVGGGVDR